MILPKKSRIFVAMSGGVDSSVAALLLKRQGYGVTGVYMKNWSDPLADECLWKDDIRDFKKVCRILRIPAIIENFEEQYRKKIVQYLIQGYRKGITPNPDMLCNREIKFKLFLQKALSLGADYIATGHYARISIDKQGMHHLLKARDANKDQSYFLALLTQKQLSHSIFPIGQFEKSTVRKIAEEAGLPVYDKPDSQGICFIGQVKFKDFIKQFIHPRPGDLVTAAGKKIGRHDGLPFYTIGQRHGLGIGGGIPYFVAKKDLKNNILMVTEGGSDTHLFSRTVSAIHPAWISGHQPPLPLTCTARIRYRQPLQICTVRNGRQALHITFKRPQRAVTPGQFIVFYKNTEVLGAGIIE